MKTLEVTSIRNYLEDFYSSTPSKALNNALFLVLFNPFKCDDQSYQEIAKKADNIQRFLDTEEVIGAERKIFEDFVAYLRERAIRPLSRYDILKAGEGE